jgi:hypothetical protein
MTDQEILKREMHERAVLFKKLVQKLGHKVLDIVGDNTVEQTREKLEQADLPNRELDTIMEILWNQMGDMAEFTVEEQTADCLRLKVTRCLFADEMRKLDAADIGLAFYCAYDDGFCQGFNPEIKFTRTRTLMQGDDCCDHTYRLEKG